MLSLSHDEVSASSGSLLENMAGDTSQRLAGLRLLFTYQATYPGKKLLFMGDEFGQRTGWDPKAELDWGALELRAHMAVQETVRDLNALYCELPALHADDADHTGFRWLDPDDAERSVIAYLRLSGEALAVVVLNFSATDYDEYVVGAPRQGAYKIVFESDIVAREEDRIPTAGVVQTVARAVMGCSYALSLRLPALSGLVLVPA